MGSCICCDRFRPRNFVSASVITKRIQIVSAFIYFRELCTIACGEKLRGEPSLKQKQKIPAYIALRFAERGVDVDKIVRYVKGDMDLEQNFVDQVLAFDDQNFYVMTGVEHVVRYEDEKRMETVFDVSDFSSRPLSELGEITVDQMVATCRLISSRDDGVLDELADSSIGRTAAFEIFAKNLNRATNRYDEKEDGPIGEEPELFCPKCGTRYPNPARKVCPKCLSKASLTFRLLGLFKNYIPQTLMILVFLILLTAFGIICPYFSTALIYDKVLADPALKAAGQIDTTYFGFELFQEVGLVVGALIITRIIHNVLNAMRSRYIGGTVPKVIFDMKLMIFSAMQRLSVGFYTSKQTGSLMTRVNADANNVYHFLIHGIPYLIASILTFIGVLSLMFTISWKLTLIVFAAVPVIVLCYALIMRVVRRMYHANWVYGSRMNALLSDALYGQRVIKAFTQEGSETDRFSAYSSRVSGAHTRLALTQTTAYPLVGLIMRTAHMVLFGVGAWLVLRGEMSIGILMTLSVYLNMLFEPLGFFTNLSNWWSSCVDSAQRIFEIVDAKSDLPEAENPVHLEKIHGDFEANNVLFEYEPGHPVVRNLTISVKSGQMLGIVGKTGSGKSTLVNLLARLYDPSEGSITLDGHNLKDIFMGDLRKNIGIVSQDIYLFIGSIADNIRYARPDASLEEVISAARAACAHDFIIKLPDGYETRVGAGGQGLSGGERQRLSIARAIIQNPSILVLDEATAAMDTETERNIQNSLTALQKGRTTIAIAHRLSTLRDADVLAVVDKGRVVEFGTHTELINIEDGIYKKLYTLQMDALKFIGTNS